MHMFMPVSLFMCVRSSMYVCAGSVGLSICMFGSVC